MFLGIHTPAYSLIAQLDPTQRCFHHNSESQWSTCLMLFQLDFGGMVCGFQRNSGERKVCLVLVPALAGLWGDEQDEEQGQGEMDWLVGARSTHSWTCSSPSSTLQQQHNLPVYLAQLCSKLLSFNGLIFSPQFSGPLPVSTGAYIIDWINSLLIVLQMWVSGKSVNWLYMSQLIKHILRF